MLAVPLNVCTYRQGHFFLQLVWLGYEKDEDFVVKSIDMRRKLQSIIELFIKHISHTLVWIELTRTELFSKDHHIH